MSDEPSDAQKLIAEVIATHRALFDGEACDACDWKFTNEYYGHDEHVAVEVDKALGGLTQKWAAHYIGDGELVTECAKWQALRCAAAQPQTVRAESYFVSGWTVTE
ncbi:hypothetical protein ACRYGU_16675 [Mycobacteroides abscessus]